MAQASKRIGPDDVRLLVLVSNPANSPQISTELHRLNQLATLGYVVRDPALKTPTFRLTAQGWGAIRDAG